jgi:hypothetical protein
MRLPDSGILTNHNNVWGSRRDDLEKRGADKSRVAKISYKFGSVTITQQVLMMS